MPEPVIVGFDGSEHGTDALVLGRTLARTLRTGLIVVIAYTPERLVWAPGTARPMAGEERGAIAAEAQAALADVDGVEVRTVGSRSAAGALHAEAARERAQLIVVGSSHRKGLGRVLPGAVTQDALDAAPCAVAVAPAGLASAPPTGFATIGVGFDDAPAAHDALGFARSLAVLAGAELRLIWAAHLAARSLPRAAIGYADPNYFREVRAEVQDRLELAAGPLREELPVSAEIASGATVGALVKRSEEVDLLVLGSRGYGPLASVLLGSVSRSVMNGAHCPVLIVPRTTGRPAGAVDADAGQVPESPAGRAA